MKKLIYAPVPEQQIIYIDKEFVVISDDKVLYLKVNNLEDILILYSILNIWGLGDSHKMTIINTLLELYDQER